MKTLTAKEAAQAVLDGKTVLAEHENQEYLIKKTPQNLFSCKYEDFGEGFNESWDFILSIKSVTYKLHEEPKKEEKKYRWLIEREDGFIFKTEYYDTFKTIKGTYVGQKTRYKKLECLDDLKDKPYYTEEF